MRVRKIWAATVIATAAFTLFVFATPAQAATATTCAVAGFVDIGPAPGGHLLGGNFSGGFNFNGTVMTCAGTVAGVATINATGAFTNAGLGITTVNGTFGTQPGLLTLPTLLGTQCGGSFGGTAVGTVAVLNLTGVSCTNGGMTGGSGIGLATFIPSGVAVCSGGPLPAPLPDTDVCLNQVIVAANFTLSGN